MEELLLELLWLVFEFLLEALLQLAGEGLIDIVLRAIGKAFSPDRPVVAATAYVFLGVLTGGASLLLFPHPLVRPSRFHGISLLISPVLVGSMMSLVGSFVRNRGKRSVQIETFLYGFAFAFGMALVRLFFAKVQ